MGDEVIGEETRQTLLGYSEAATAMAVTGEDLWVLGELAGSGQYWADDEGALTGKLAEARRFTRDEAHAVQERWAVPLAAEGRMLVQIAVSGQSCGCDD